MNRAMTRLLFRTFVPVQILLLVAPPLAYCDSENDLSKCLREVLRRHDVPAIAVAVVNESGIVASGAAGVRERGRPEQISLSDRFHLGSNTKAMTATLCARLVEKGILRWDTKLIDVSPALKRKMLPRYQSITLEQLLTHRAGFPTSVLGNPQEIQELDMFHDKFPGRPKEARERCAEFLVSQLPSPTENQFVYSNANYVLVSHMVEAELRTSFEESMQEHLFTPLGMSSAGFGAPGTDNLNNQPRGHYGNGRPVSPGSVESDNPRLYAGSGTVHGSLADWAKFIQFHLTRGKSHSDLLGGDSFSVLHLPKKSTTHPSEFDTVAPGALGYSMGWFVFPDGVLTHSGTNLRWHSQTAVIPKHRVAVLVACNQGGEQAEKACLEVIQSQIRSQIAR